MFPCCLRRVRLLWIRSLGVFFLFFFFFLLFPCYVSPPSFPPSSSFHARIFTFSSAFSVRAALLACLLLFAHIKSVIPPRWRWGLGVVGFCFVLFCYFLFESQEGREEEAGWLVGCHRQNSGGEGCFCWTCLRFFFLFFCFFSLDLWLLSGDIREDRGTGKDQGGLTG